MYQNFYQLNFFKSMLVSFNQDHGRYLVCIAVTMTTKFPLTKYSKQFWKAQTNIVILSVGASDQKMHICVGLEGTDKQCILSLNLEDWNLLLTHVSVSIWKGIKPCDKVAHRLICCVLHSAGSGQTCLFCCECDPVFLSPLWLTVSFDP